MPAGGYVICEYEKVKDAFPEFNAMMQSLRNALIAKCEADWAPQRYAGRRKTAMGFATPGPGLDLGTNEFGETTIIPALFRDISLNTLVTWEQNFNATGSQMIMSGANAGAIYEDYKIGIAGIAFLSKAIRISEIKMQISDKKLPRINVEEAFVYNHPAIIFEEPFILDEETQFDLHAWVLSQGPQRIKLIGPQMNRVRDKLMTTPGAALT